MLTYLSVSTPYCEAEAFLTIKYNRFLNAMELMEPTRDGSCLRTRPLHFCWDKTYTGVFYTKQYLRIRTHKPGIESPQEAGWRTELVEI
jgi:hypothetical protein